MRKFFLALVFVVSPSFLYAAELQRILETEIGDMPVITDPSTGKVLRIGAQPPITYNGESDEYEVPVVTTTTTTAVDPAAAAGGDATEKPVILGKTIIAKVPGTDIVKLADGTYTTVTGSDTLQNAKSELSSSAKYDNKIVSDVDLCSAYYYCFPGSTIQSTTFFVGENVVTINPSSISTYSSNGQTCDSRYGLPDGFYISKNLTYAYSCNDGIPKDSYVLNASVLPFDPNKYSPSSPSPTSDELASRIIDKLADAFTNGLAEDFKKACEAGGNCKFGDTNITKSEIDSWKAGNDSIADQSISQGIESGQAQSSTDGSGTGAAQTQTFQSAGIQNTLNKILRALGGGSDPAESDTSDTTHTPDLPYSPTESSVPYVLEEVDFGVRFSEFTTSLKNSSLFGVPNAVFVVPGGGTSLLVVDGGNLFGSISFDLSQMSNAWGVLRSIVLVGFSFIAVRIVSKGGA